MRQTPIAPNPNRIANAIVRPLAEAAGAGLGSGAQMPLAQFPDAHWSEVMQLPPSGTRVLVGVTVGVAVGVVVTVGVVVLVDVGVFVGVTVGVGGMQLPSTQVPPSHEDTHSVELSQHGHRGLARATSQVMPSVPIQRPGATAVTHVPRLQHCPLPHAETHSVELSQHGHRGLPRATSQVPSVPIHIPGATAVTHVPRLQHCPVGQGGLHGWADAAPTNTTIAAPVDNNAARTVRLIGSPWGASGHCQPLPYLPDQMWPYKRPWRLRALRESARGVDHVQKMFTDFAREVTPVNPDLRKLAEVSARYGAKLAV